LIEQAPQDGTTPRLIEAIAPILKQIAGRLRHPQYYVLQTLNQSWIVTTLNQRSQAGVEKNVVYAFSTLKDVASGPYQLQDPEVLALPMPIAHILFYLISMPGLDSMIFFDTPGNVDIGTEIVREELTKLIQGHMQKLSTTSSNLPPDVA
ncbi:MAG TPA: hypothetical protein V6D16_08980, partial [Candidatus Obscuribacterales bacterium]